MAIILVFKTNQEEAIELPLFAKTVIGRSSSADFKLNDEKISSKHCSIELTRKGEVLFTDLDSTNGSQLNNSSIAKSIIKINDRIIIGDTLIQIKPDLLSALERKQIGLSSYKYEPGISLLDPKKD